MAVGKLLIAAFGVLNTVTNSMLVFETNFSGAFTPSEKAHLDKIKARLHDDGEYLRKLGWRLIRSADK